MKCRVVGGARAVDGQAECLEGQISADVFGLKSGVTTEGSCSLVLYYDRLKGITRNTQLFCIYYFLLLLAIYVFIYFFISLIADGPQRTILLVVTEDLPISPRLAPYEFLCKFSTLTTRQPMVEFYLFTSSRFPLRKK